MIIINEHSEEKLAKALETIKNKGEAERCIYLQFSQLQSKTSAISNIISDIIDDPKNQIFFCQDGDVFILSNSVTHEVFEKLNLHLATFLNLATLDGLSTLYDLESKWSVVSVLVDEKLSYKANKRKEETKKEQENCGELLRQAILDAPIEPELLDTIADRRNEREKPEIIIVEDDEFSRRLIGNSLKGEYKVTAVENGKQAILTYAMIAPDVIFLDIELPDITGHDILSKIMSFDPNAYIVMLSGKGDKKNVLSAMKNGAQGFVTKPFAKKKLLQYIEKCPTVGV